MDKPVGKSSTLISKGSVFDLSAVYIMLHLRRKPTPEEQKDIVYGFNNILDSGYTFKVIISALFNSFLLKIKLSNPSDLASLLRNKPKENIIKQKIYYHKELRVQPEPSVTEVDYNTGTMISSGQEFFVEVAASYTMNDLIQYLLSFGYVNTTEYPINRLKGLLNFYLKKYDLDTVLFMMEAIADSIEDKQTFNLERFDSYYSTATGYMHNIKNNCRATGGDVIIPRKRKLFG